MTIALTLVTSEAWFHFEQASMCFMIFLAFVGLAPFTFGYMLGVGLFVVLVHTAFMAIHGGQLPAVYAIFCSLMVVSSYLIACCGAYARERNFRREFAERAEPEHARAGAAQ